MAWDKVNGYSIGDVSFNDMIYTLDKTFINISNVSLTNMSNTTVPAIAAGSIVEVGGALYPATTEQAISTTDPVTGSTVADGFIYIMLTASGTSMSAAFTATAPTWSDAKQGWYGTGTYAGCRYVDWMCLKATNSYKKARAFRGRERIAYITGSSVVSTTAGIASQLVSTPTVNIGGSSYAANAITVAEGGLYSINFSGTTNTTTVNLLCDVSLLINGVAIHRGNYTAGHSPTYGGLSLSCIKLLYAGDVIKIQITDYDGLIISATYEFIKLL